jgi:hypothetical protein
MKSNLLSLAGAVAGGALGYFAFFWLVSQGYYGLVLPGGLLGMGAGMVRNKSVVVAILCGLMATALGVYTEWRYFPFKEDPSLKFFLTHLNDLKPLTLVMMGLGGFIGFWIPFRNKSRATLPVQPAPGDST